MVVHAVVDQTIIFAILVVLNNGKEKSEIEIVVIEKIVIVSVNIVTEIVREEIATVVIVNVIATEVIVKDDAEVDLEIEIEIVGIVNDEETVIAIVVIARNEKEVNVAIVETVRNVNVIAETVRTVIAENVTIESVNAATVRIENAKEKIVMIDDVNVMIGEMEMNMTSETKNEIIITVIKEDGNLLKMVKSNKRLLHT